MAQQNFSSNLFSSSPIPASGSDPRFANYRVPASSTNQSANAIGNTIFANTGSGNAPGAPTPSAAPTPPAPPSNKSFQQQWEEAGHTGPVPEGYHGEGGGGGGGDDSNAISEAYAPALEALKAATDAANLGAEEQTASTERAFTTGTDRANRERGELTTTTEEQQTSFNKKIRSAFEEAVRAHNALSQQRIARFGGGSSAGGAVGELASKEFFRQQGNINEQQFTGDLAFSKEFGKIGLFISDKLTDLDNWKKDALMQVQQNLRNTIVAIGQQRGTIEANKTRDKIASLEAARTRVLAIQASDVQFRQNLALASISQAQEVSGRVFTPQEINATLSKWGIPLRGISQGVISQAPITGLPGTREDDLKDLISTG